MELDLLRLSSRDEFQSWLFNDLELRDELYALIGRELDPDEGSLDRLEAFLLDRYAGPDDALRPDQHGVLDAAARHIGLVVILNVDGALWDIDLDTEDSAYYRLPVIVLADGARECPLSMATACLDRRTGDYLHTLVTKYERAYNAEPPP
jgi:hypothetical protein